MKMFSIKFSLETTLSYHNSNLLNLVSFLNLFLSHGEAKDLEVVPVGFDKASGDLTAELKITMVRSNNQTEVLSFGIKFCSYGVVITTNGKAIKIHTYCARSAAETIYAELGLTGGDGFRPTVRIRI